MRGRWQIWVILGLLVGNAGSTQGHVAVAQTVRSRTPPPIPPRQEPVPLVRDRLEITDDETATGDARKLQQEIAAQFARQPLYPKEPMKEFAWIKSPPEDRRMGTWICG